MKICTIVGTRPQFIKSVLVSRELKARGIEEVLIHTGQHHDHEMSQIFFDEFKLDPPKWQYEDNLDTPLTHISRILGWLEKVLGTEKPDKILVYGDCNSTLSGVLAGRKLNIPVAHVEAGPRQHDMAIPEEQNRFIADHLATWRFCPTKR